MRAYHRHMCKPCREAWEKEHVTKQEELDAQHLENGPLVQQLPPLSDFERLAGDVIAGLPEDVLAVLENVSVVVAPGEEESQQGTIARFQGIPRVMRTRWYSGFVPDVITIYQRSVELLGQNDETLMRDVLSRAIRHEIGHHLGLGHEQMGERVDQVKQL